MTGPLRPSGTSPKWQRYAYAAHLGEAKREDDLLDKLDKVALSKIDRADFRALMRLQTWFTGKTHELFLDFSAKAEQALLQNAGDVLDATSAFAAQVEIYDAWGETFSAWSALFERVRQEAVWIVFGVQAQLHERMLRPAISELASVINEVRFSPLSGPPVSEADIPPNTASQIFRGRELNEGIRDGVFEPQLRILLDVAAEYVYGDGLNTPARVWKIDREFRDDFNLVLLNGVQQGDSAYNVAKQLEQLIGAGADCPRWTSTRLYGMTPSERRTSAAGLIRGAACDGQGVSYRALRLARTEIQKIHDQAFERQAAQLPFVDLVQVHLSPAHSKDTRCECETIVAGGENGDGVYPVGEIDLPIHPNCLCFKTFVLMSEAVFTARLNGWLNETQPWAEMDAYAQTLGGDVDVDIRPVGINLAVWLLSNNLDEWMAAP